MRKQFTTAAVIVAALGLAVARAASGAAGDDGSFVTKAATGGMMEAELGQYAARNAANDKVRQFGRQMHDDHTKANQELEAIARKSGLSVPKAVDSEQRATMDKLMKLEGAEFDREYMRAMVDDHKKVADAFRAQAKAGTSEVDKWAAKTLPTIEAHLDHAQGVQSQLVVAPQTSQKTGASRY